jgi:hypothetical protein
MIRAPSNRERVDELNHRPGMIVAPAAAALALAIGSLDWRTAFSP